MSLEDVDQLKDEDFEEFNEFEEDEEKASKEAMKEYLEEG